MSSKTKDEILESRRDEKMDRRDFLKAGGILSVGKAFFYGLPLLPIFRSHAASGKGLTTTSRKGSTAKLRWGMVIDLKRCLPGCNACLEACRRENNVAFHGDTRWDIHLIRKVKIRRKNPVGSPERDVLLLCNHCDDPPCAQVCPVKATYKRDDGIVIVDYHRCIGCRYCMTACPYNARYFNYKENHEWPNKDYPQRAHGVPESCNFCAHLLDKGKRPACVEACERINSKALVFGNLNDPDSDVSRMVSNNPVRGIREDLGTKPKVYYIGL